MGQGDEGSGENTQIAPTRPEAMALTTLNAKSAGMVARHLKKEKAFQKFFIVSSNVCKLPILSCTGK